jgi:hypothetical protein
MILCNIIINFKTLGRIDHYIPKDENDEYDDL